MAGSLNRVELIGNVGRDPETVSTTAGGRIVKLSLATSETWKDRQSGEKRERTEWHNIVVFNEQIGEVIEKYVRKGSKIFIEGKMQTRKWTDQDGKDRYSTEVVLQAYDSKLILLGGDKQESGGASRRQRQQEDSGFGDAYEAPAPKRATHDALDDSIPF